MLARLYSVTLEGIDGILCEVEFEFPEAGFEKPIIVGLPDAAVKESIERVRSAVVNSGYSFPNVQPLINLAPADIKKAGPAFDLPIHWGLWSVQEFGQRKIPRLCHHRRTGSRRPRQTRQRRPQHGHDRRRQRLQRRHRTARQRRRSRRRRRTGSHCRRLTRSGRRFSRRRHRDRTHHAGYRGAV